MKGIKTFGGVAVKGNRLCAWMRIPCADPKPRRQYKKYNHFIGLPILQARTGYNGNDFAENIFTWVMEYGMLPEGAIVKELVVFPSQFTPYRYPLLKRMFENRGSTYRLLKYERYMLSNDNDGRVHVIAIMVKK